MGSRGDQLFVICVCPHSLTKHNSSFLRVQTIKVLQTCTLAASNKLYLENHHYLKKTIGRKAYIVNKHSVREYETQPPSSGS
ncbi:hypothetical protein BDE02_02G121400 [Populus trichocarpa]|nr:hypothetical protein BDE02_02G121400 [Populus trichocarpa]